MTAWDRERWRKLYLREPADQEIMAWQARGLRDLLIRLAEDDGRVARDIPALTRRLRAGIELVEHVEALLEDGFLVVQDGGLYVRNLPDAQGVAAAPRASRGPQEPGSAPRGRWAGTTAEERTAAARRASEARWGRRIGDASGDGPPDASTDMRRDASTHRIDASSDASSPRAVSGDLDPLQTLEEEEKRGEKRREDTRADDASGDASTHRRMTHGAPNDMLRASFGGPQEEDLWAFGRWQVAFGKTGAEFTGRRTMALADRRAAGMTRADVDDALAGAKLDDWVMGRRDGQRHDSIHCIFGDADRYEGFRDAGRAVRTGTAPVVAPRPLVGVRPLRAVDDIPAQLERIKQLEEQEALDA